MSKWTVTPETDRIECEFDGEGFWIEVKRTLTTGESMRLRSSGFRGYAKANTADVEAGRVTEEDVDMEVDINWDALVFAKVHTYLTGWSLADGDDPLPCTMKTLNALVPGVFKVIEDAIDKHIDERQKKLSSGKLKPVKT